MGAAPSAIIGEAPSLWLGGQVSATYIVYLTRTYTRLCANKLVWAGAACVSQNTCTGACLYCGISLLAYAYLLKYATYYACHAHIIISLRELALKQSCTKARWATLHQKALRACMMFLLLLCVCVHCVNIYVEDYKHCETL